MHSWDLSNSKNNHKKEKLPFLCYKFFHQFFFICLFEYLFNIYISSIPVKAGKSPDPAAGKGKFSKKWTMYKSRMMNKFKKKYYAKTANLLTGTYGLFENQKKSRNGILFPKLFSQWSVGIIFETEWFLTCCWRFFRSQTLKQL